MENSPFLPDVNASVKSSKSVVSVKKCGRIMSKKLFLVWIYIEIVSNFSMVTAKDKEISFESSRYLSETEETRSIFQLGHMIRCQTGCDPLRYKRYGCFCGFKGAGKPVDVID
ncbi:phospholipase A(2) [Trichonephila clavipes]|nr:phospholipase A(2) [Trichonephila clavipes]